jgi:tape measure domain-containing protein
VKLQVKIDDSTASKSIDTLSSKTDNLAKSFTNAGKTLTVGLTVPITGLIVAGVKYNSTVETLTASFKVMTGSAEEAADIVSQLKEIGAKTPYEFTGLADTVQLLMQYGQTSKQAIAVTKMVGDVSQGSAEKMNSIALAYGQMSSAGKVNLMDLKQMIAAGFNPLQIISDKTGESMASMYDRISNGTMSVSEITDAFTYATSEGGKFYGSSEEQSKTLAGRLSTLKDNFNEATGSLTESLVPALENLVDKLTKAASWFAGLDENQRKMILTILAVVAAIGPFLLIVSKTIGFIDLLTKATWLWNGALLASPITWIVLGIVALIAIIVLLITHFNEIKNVVIGVWQVIKDVFGEIGSFIASVFRGIANAFISMANLVIRGLNTLIKGFLSPFNLIIKGLNKIPGVNIPALKLAIPNIPALNVGTNYVAQEGLAYLHQGEAVVPKKYNPAIGGGNANMSNPVYVNVEVQQDKFGNYTNTIKTFSNGAKNSYNYGAS